MILEQARRIHAAARHTFCMVDGCGCRLPEPKPFGRRFRPKLLLGWGSGQSGPKAPGVSDPHRSNTRERKPVAYNSSQNLTVCRYLLNVRLRYISPLWTPERALGRSPSGLSTNVTSSKGHHVGEREPQGRKHLVKADGSSWPLLYPSPAVR